MSDYVCCDSLDELWNNAQTEPLMERLSRRFNEDEGETTKWLNTKHPGLGNKTPISMIQQGNIQPVFQLAEKF